MDIEKETGEMKVKVQETPDKLIAIQAEAEKRSAEKDEEVKAKKEGLLDRLKILRRKRRKSRK